MACLWRTPRFSGGGNRTKGSNAAGLSMIQLALVPLLFVAVMLFRRYGIAAAAHPGVWFSAAWTLAIGCYTLMDWFDGVPVHNQEQINELLMFLVFTSGAFLLFALLFPGGCRRLQ